MKNHFWIFFVVYLTIHSASFVRSEYTWNGSEWVWTDSENGEQSPSSPIEEEGSGDYDTYEDEDGDSWDDDNEGSGDSNSVDNNFKPTKPGNGNNNYNDPYNNYGMNSNVNNNYGGNNNNNNFGGGTNSNVPTNNWAGNTNTGGSDPYNMNQDNNQPKPEPPYYGNEVEKTADNDINFVEQPVVPTQPAEPTNVVPQQPNNNYNDPSIISRPKNSNTRSTSFFAQPGTLAAVIGGAVVGLLCAILCVMFVVYRMRKKDEGSYALDEPKRSPTVNAYAKHPSREFYA